MRLFAGMLLAALLLPPLAAASLPAPTGPYVAGTRSVILSDASRREVVQPDAGRPRTVPVTLWYPAERASGREAPYASTVVAKALADRLGLKTGFEREIRTHAFANAAIASGKFHAVLLNHGLGMVPELYTGFATELASHGFVVIAVNHTFTSAVAETEAGTRTYTPPWPRNVDRAVQGARMGEYVATWVADDRFALDQLASIAKMLRWKNSIDTSSVVAIGHSYGGTTAGVIAGVDDRVAGVINLDGSIYPNMRPVESKVPMLILTTPETTSLHDEFRGPAGRTFKGVVAGSKHMTYSDAPLLQSSPAGSESTTQALLRFAAVRVALVEFTRHILLDAPAPVLQNVLRVEAK